VPLGRFAWHKEREKKMEKFFKAIEEKIRKSGYPEAANLILPPPIPQSTVLRIAVVGFIMV
jgi:hypothetical protein